MIVCMPTRGSISVETFSAALRNGYADLPIVPLISSRKAIDVARNELAAMARALIERPAALPWQPTELLVFWHDDDAFWTPDSVRRAVQYLQAAPQIDLLAGNFCAREPFCAASGIPSPGVPCDPDEGAVQIVVTGFHWVMHRASVLKRIGPDPFSVIGNLSEDFSFCKRANAAGIRMFCARDIVIPHVDADTGLAYLPGQAAWQSNGTSLIPPAAQTLHNYGETVDAARIRVRERAQRFEVGASALTGGGE